MPHGSHLTRPFLVPPRPLTAYERGRDLCTFVSTAASHVMRTLQRPCRNRPGKRKVNHRRFLQNQICRSFSDIEAATRRLASSILSQEALTPPIVTQHMSPPKPQNPPPAMAPSGSFLGTAKAFVAPNPSSSWGPSLDSLMSEPDELFEPISEEAESTSNIWSLCGPDSLGSCLLGCKAQPILPCHVGSAACGSWVGSNMYPPVADECPVSAYNNPGALVVSDHESCVPFWEVEMW
ncbi:uncharacterized protein C19orf85 homolog [Rhineura floridana]|uniref:uncharacterized protein C19orf85 homolog n=1 Tax=Rhineura floridana TaxID=261503 RepID=UPI002AC851F1|nr:uncharacterized protein C19orf85 homolog [Rhineura floridana]